MKQLAIIFAWMITASALCSNASQSEIIEIKKKKILVVNKKLVDDDTDFIYSEPNKTITTNVVMHTMNNAADVLGPVYTNFYISGRLHIIEKLSGVTVWSSETPGTNRSLYRQLVLSPTLSICESCDNQEILSAHSPYSFDLSSFIDALPTFKDCEYLNTYYRFKVDIELHASSDLLFPLTFPLDNTYQFDNCEDFWPTECFEGHFTSHQTLISGIDCIGNEDNSYNFLSTPISTYKNTNYSHPFTKYAIQTTDTSCIKNIYVTSINGSLIFSTKSSSHYEQVKSAIFRSHPNTTLIICTEYCNCEYLIKKVRTIH